MVRRPHYKIGKSGRFIQCRRGQGRCLHCFDRRGVRLIGERPAMSEHAGDVTAVLANPHFRGRSRQILPPGGKPDGTTVGTPFCGFVVSLEQSNRYQNPGSASEAEGAVASRVGSHPSRRGWRRNAKGTLSVAFVARLRRVLRLPRSGKVAGHRSVPSVQFESVNSIERRCPAMSDKMSDKCLIRDVPFELNQTRLAS